MKQALKTLLLVLSISLINCKDEDKSDLFKIPSEISTLEVTEITATTAVAGGEMDDYWKGLRVGIRWSTNPETINLEYLNNTYSASPGKRFFIEMTDLTPDTKYYVMAFVANRHGFAEFGEMMQFTTLAE